LSFPAAPAAALTLVTVQAEVFVIVSETKQSMIAAKVDCFVVTLLAMTRKIPRLSCTYYIINARKH
jgi:hypothetical protein